MGCDIHLYVERRESGEWISADKWTPSKYGETEGLEVEYDNRFYNGRNYDLFAILADVRNGRGFAGCDTGDGFIPIIAPRGLPDDVSADVKRMSDAWDADGHSHSYLTVSEMLAYDWTQTTKKHGWVDVQEWARWRDYGNPREWSGGISGSSIDHVAPEALEKAWVELRDERGYPKERYASAHLTNHSERDNADILALMDKVSGPSRRPFCQVAWEVPYYKQAKEFLGTAMPRLWRLGAPEDVRIVFWFDN